MLLIKQHMNATTRNFSELHKNQVTLDNDREVLKKQMKETLETVENLDCKISVYRTDYERYKKEFDAKIQKLMHRVDKAEADRMDKYYKQVSEVQDWVHKVREKVDYSAVMAEGVANFFGTLEFQVVVNNTISEVLSSTLEGR